MTEQGKSLPSSRIRVTIRLEVPLGSSLSDIRRVYERWGPRVEVDEAYPPVPISAPRGERESLLRQKLQLVVVRAWVDPRDLDALREQPGVHHVTRAARLEPFARLEPGLVARAVLPRVDCGDVVRPNDTAARVAQDLGVTQIWRAGYTGRGLVVGVVDGGITAHGRPTTVGGWPAIPQAPAVGEVVGGWPVASWGTTAEGWGTFAQRREGEALKASIDLKWGKLKLFRGGSLVP